MHGESRRPEPAAQPPSRVDTTGIVGFIGNRDGRPVSVIRPLAPI